MIAAFPSKKNIISHKHKTKPNNDETLHHPILCRRYMRLGIVSKHSRLAFFGRRYVASINLQFLGSKFCRPPSALLFQLPQPTSRPQARTLLASSPCHRCDSGCLPAHRQQAISQYLSALVARSPRQQLRGGHQRPRPLVEPLRRRHGVDSSCTNKNVGKHRQSPIHR